MITPIAKPIPFFSTGPQSTSSLGPTGDVVGVPEVLTLGGGGLLGAEEA